jgi:hypothetical protein
VRARSLESVSRTPSFAQLILDSSGSGVEDSDDALFTRHTFFVFFGGDEVSEALAGMFLVSVFSTFALFVSFDLLGWWHPLNAFILLFLCLECECHVPSPYAELNSSGSDINSCVDIS